MSKEKLFRGIGFIDDELIDEAAEMNEKRGLRITWQTAAACAAAAVLITAAATLPWGGRNDLTVSPSDPQPEQPQTSIVSPTEQSNENSPGADRYALVLNTAGAELARADIFLHFTIELNEEQKNAVFPGINPLGALQATAAYDKNGQPVRIYAGFISGENAFFQQGMEANIRIYPGAQSPVIDYIFDIEPCPSYINGNEVIAGQYKNEYEDETVYFASYASDDAAYYIEMRGGKAEKAALPAIIERLMSGKADMCCLENPVIPELRSDELNEQQAYSEADFGRYLPDISVNGLKFESGRRYIDQNENYLRVLWSQWETQGYDELFITFSTIDDSDRNRIVSVDSIELYDLSFYPIPRAESVPDELWDVINAPIFKAEEITLDAVTARTEYFEEPGDEGARASFSVLYGDILMDISSKGLSAQEIYDIIIQVGRNF